MAAMFAAPTRALGPILRHPEPVDMGANANADADADVAVHADECVGAEWVRVWVQVRVWVRVRV